MSPHSRIRSPHHNSSHHNTLPHRPPRTRIWSPHNRLWSPRTRIRSPHHNTAVTTRHTTAQVITQHHTTSPLPCNHARCIAVYRGYLYGRNVTLPRSEANASCLGCLLAAAGIERVNVRAERRLMRCALWTLCGHFWGIMRSLLGSQAAVRVTGCSEGPQLT